MIPLCLVTGFLGSGKTTLLRNLAEAHSGRGLAFLVNDFGSVDIDGALVHEADERVVSVAGGSIFCKCLVTEFIQILGSLPERFDPAGVVVEASGIADPRVVRKMLAETGLDRTYDLRSVVTVVDPGRFLKLIHTLPNIRSQVEAADTVLINKEDLHHAEMIQATEKEIQSIQPAVRILKCVQCQANLDPFNASDRARADGDYAPCTDPNYARFSIPGDHLSPADLQQGITELGDDIYRIKGFIRDDTTTQYVDYAGGELDVKPAKGAPDLGLVLIARGLAKQRVQEWLDQGAADSNPPG